MSDIEDQGSFRASEGTMLERMARAICSASCGTPDALDYDGLPRHWAIHLSEARADLEAIREPSALAHNAAALSEHQSKPPKIVAREDGTLAIEWRPADPGKLFTAMIDAILQGKA